MVRKGNLAVFESSNISKTKDITSTKIGVYALDINPYMHEFFQLIPFLKVAISLKPERQHSPKLVCMSLTSIPTCINFLSQFQSIKFFDTHGL